MIWFIVNPLSGNGRGIRVWRHVEEVLKQRGIHYGVRFTERQGHAKELAERLSAEAGVTAVAAVGGDGTVHEVANGVAGSSAAIGCIPAGSGNDFARGLGIPRDWQGALDRILLGRPSAIDAAVMNGRLFAISAGLGFDGDVAKWTNRASYKRWLNRIGLGSMSYVVTVLRLLATYEPCDVRFVVDGRRLDYRNVWLVAIANMPYYGVGMNICPGAAHDDGILHMLLVENISRFDLLRFFPKVFKGTHTEHPSVHVLTGKSIVIESDRPMTAHADGEYAGETPAMIEVLPKRLLAL